MGTLNCSVLLMNEFLCQTSQFCLQGGLDWSENFIYFFCNAMEVEIHENIGAKTSS
jgi:hypothetical protein